MTDTPARPSSPSRGRSSTSGRGKAGEKTPSIKSQRSKSRSSRGSRKGASPVPKESSEAKGNGKSPKKDSLRSKRSVSSSSKKKVKDQKKPDTEEITHTILHKGILRKKSPRAVMGRHLWQRRFVVLTTDSVTYFTKAPDSLLRDPNGIIPIELIQQVLVPALQKSKGNRYRFDIYVKDNERIFQFYTDTREGETWLKALHKAITDKERGKHRRISMPATLDPKTKFWKPKIQKELKKRRRSAIMAEASAPAQQGISPKQLQLLRKASMMDDKMFVEEETRNTEKTQKQIQCILSACQHCLAFRTLDAQQVKKIVSLMWRKEISAGTDVIEEGEEMGLFYVVEKGEFTVEQSDGEHITNLGVPKRKTIRNIGEGAGLGELALVQRTVSPHTITATVDCVCWLMDRATFKGVLTKYASQKLQSYEAFLKGTELIGSLLDPESIAKVAEALDQSVYAPGEKIVTEGEEGNVLYILKSGECRATINGKEVQRYVKKGDYFGERALLKNARRAATVAAVTKVEVLHLGRRAFTGLLGPIQAFQKNALERVAAYVPGTPKKLSSGRPKGVHTGKSTGKAGVRVRIHFNPKKPKRDSVHYKQVVGGVESGERRRESDLKRGTSGGGSSRGREKSSGGKSENAYSESDDDDTTYGGMSRPPWEMESPYQTRRSVSPGGSASGRGRRTSSSFRLPLTGKEGDWGKQSSAEDARLRAELAVKLQTSGTLSVNDLRIVGTLGRGSFGRVQLVHYAKTDSMFALKAISKQHLVKNNQVGFIINEKKTMAQLTHPFIVRLFGAMGDENFIYFLLEPSMGGELFGVLNDKERLTESHARFYAACIVLAFEYMHSKNILYRDLKPENLLLDNDGYIKITDFGFAKQTTERTYTFCGTPDYLAPEIVANRGHGVGADWWTLGILIYEMLSGGTPFFDEKGPEAMYNKILSGRFTFPSYFSVEVKDLLTKLLALRPTQRLGVLKDGALAVKRHTWFQGFDWDGLYHRRLPAPLVPTISGPSDLRNFDGENQGVGPYDDAADAVDEYEETNVKWDDVFA